MSDRTQGSVRTGSRTGESAPAQGTATGQQPATDGALPVGATQSIPGANTARTQAQAAGSSDGGAPAAAGPASGTQTAVPPVTGDQPAAGGLADDGQVAAGAAPEGGERAEPAVLLADDALQDDPPSRAHTGVAQRLDGQQLAGQARLHVAGAPAEHAAVADLPRPRRRRSTRARCPCRPPAGAARRGAGPGSRPRCR